MEVKTEMKIIAIEKELPESTPKKFREYADLEAKTAWKLYQEGILRELYFRADKTCSVLVLECDNLEQAEKYLQTLPFVKEGLIIFDLIPLKPYPGFSRLFKNDKQGN